MVQKFWNWSVTAAPGSVTQNGCWMDNSDPAVAFLMEPVDADDAYMPVLQQQGCSVTSTQSILIPLWVAWADQNEHPGLGHRQLGECAKGEYNLGVITAKVWLDSINDTDPTIADLSATLSRTGGNAGDDPPVSVTETITTSNNVTEYTTTDDFPLNIPAKSSKRNHRPGSSTRAAGHGFYVLLPPLARTPPGHRVRYKVTVDLPPPPSFQSPDICYPFGPVDITYFLTVR
jgi:hypothetical protein